MHKIYSNKFVQCTSSLRATWGQAVCSLRACIGSATQVMRTGRHYSTQPVYKYLGFTPLYTSLATWLSHSIFAPFISVNKPLLPTIHSANKNNKRLNYLNSFIIN